MALYPDTSCFYRAEVIASPRDSRVRAERDKVSPGMTFMDYFADVKKDRRRASNSSLHAKVRRR